MLRCWKSLKAIKTTTSYNLRLHVCSVFFIQHLFRYIDDNQHSRQLAVDDSGREDEENLANNIIEGKKVEEDTANR